MSEAIGINSLFYRNVVFVVAAALAGLAGILFSVYTGTASPGDYTFVYGINILIFVIVGGPARFAGPIIGTVALTVVGEALRGYLELVPLIYGIILIVVILLEPQGLVALPQRISSQVKKWAGRRIK